MSWETSTYQRPCFCGKGKIVSESQSDDWGNSEELGEKLVCEACDKVYEWREYSAAEAEYLRVTGKSNSSGGWVKRAT